MAQQQRIYERHLSDEIHDLMSIYPVRKKGLEVLPGPLAPSTSQKSTKLVKEEVRICLTIIWLDFFCIQVGQCSPVLQTN